MLDAVGFQPLGAIALQDGYSGENDEFNRTLQRPYDPFGLCLLFLSPHGVIAELGSPHTLMRLKRAFLNTDFRHQQLVLAFGPFLIWAGATTLAVLFWRRPWGLPSALLLFFAGGMLATKLPWAAYALASRSLPAPLKGSPGKHFLLLHSEPPETFHKLHVLPEDAGFIYAENGCYRITTLKHDFSIPFNEFHHEPIKKAGVGKALLLRFQPSGTTSVVELAATFGYFGNDLKVAADTNLKCEWASKVLESMKA